MLSTTDKNNACHTRCQWLSCRHLPVYDAFSLVGVLGNASCGRGGTGMDSFFWVLHFRLDNYFHVIFAENESTAIPHIPNSLISNPNTYLSSATNTESRGHHPLFIAPPRTKHSIYLLFGARFQFGAIRFVCLLTLQNRRDHTFDSEPE